MVDRRLATWFTRHMTPTTVLTTDQNTGRQITWNVAAANAVPAGRTQWTHMLIVTRPKGRGVAYTMWVEIEPATGQVVRQSTVRKAW